MKCFRKSDISLYAPPKPCNSPICPLNKNKNKITREDTFFAESDNSNNNVNVFNLTASSIQSSTIKHSSEDDINEISDLRKAYEKALNLKTSSQLI